MTIQKTLEMILARLDKIEKRLDAVPDTFEMGGLIATTAARDDVHELQGSVDAIYDLIDGQEQRDALRDIRTSLRDRRAS